MSDPSEVTDPSDWLGTPLSALERLDHALRCQVCKEFLNSPMLTTCAHTFCSLCIRRCLSADGKCPFCRAPDQPNQLRKNNAIEEAVSAFLSARPTILKVARNYTAEAKRGQTEGEKGRKRTVQQAELGDVNGMSPRKTRSSGLRAAEGKAATPVLVEDSEDEYRASETDGEESAPSMFHRLP